MPSRGSVDSNCPGTAGTKQFRSKLPGNRRDQQILEYFARGPPPSRKNQPSPKNQSSRNRNSKAGHSQSSCGFLFEVAHIAPDTATNENQQGAELARRVGSRCCWETKYQMIENGGLPKQSISIRSYFGPSESFCCAVASSATFRRFFSHVHDADKMLNHRA